MAVTLLIEGTVTTITSYRIELLVLEVPTLERILLK